MHEPAHPRLRIEVLLLLNAAQWRWPLLLRMPQNARSLQLLMQDLVLRFAQRVY